ncbi:MAG: aldo/keto reductase [Sumerlaeia bacterium]
MSETASFAEDRYDKMRYRRCGRSGLVLPEVSLGLWQSLGEKGNEALCKEACFYAFDQGVNHFDLANNYGPPFGYAEESFGRVLKEMPRDELIISTKAGYRMWPGPFGEGGSKKYLVASLDQSLKRMGLDYVDIFYHHCPDDRVMMEESLETLDLIVKQGKALYVGVSSYRGHQFAEAAELVRARGWAPLTIHQPMYNMVDRWVESELMPQTERTGTGIIAFCPLGQGLLTDKYLRGVPEDSRVARTPHLQERLEKWRVEGWLAKVARLNDFAQERDMTMAQLAIAWLLRDPRLTSVLIGASRMDQLKENLAAVRKPPLTKEHCEAIGAILTE